MVRFNIECTIAFPQREFWRIRDTPSFIRFVVDDGLLKGMSSTKPVVGDDGWLTREQQYCPAHVDCPDFIRPIVGETMFEVKDFQRWNEDVQPFHLNFTIRPTFLTALSNTRGELSIERFPGDDGEDTREEEDVRNDDNEMVEQKQKLVKDEIDNAKSERCDDCEEKDKPKAEDEDDKPSYKPAATDTPLKSTPARPRSAEDLVSEIGSTSTGTSTDSDSDNTEASESSDDDESNHCDPLVGIEQLPPSEKSIHRVIGQTRVRILTLGWFVERAIVHNLRQFYKGYPLTLFRFRRKLYREFACGDMSVPISVVVDRYMEREKEQMAQELAEKAAENGEPTVTVAAFEEQASSDVQSEDGDIVASRCPQESDSRPQCEMKSVPVGS